MRFTSKRTVRIAALCSILFTISLSPALAAEPPVRTSPWDPMRFFIGTWTGAGTGQPGESSVHREYGWALNNRFIEVHNQSTYSPQPKNPKGEVHEDRGMISWDRRRHRFVLRQFHVEGFVNQYVADSLAAPADSVVFRSESIENIPPGFRARETYRLLGPNEFIERFEMAEPGSDFSIYSETRFTRDTANKRAAP